MEPQFLSLDEVLEIHQQQIEIYGGSPGVRDPAALESAVATPQATFEVINDWDLELGSDELVDVVLDLASGKLGKPELTQIFAISSHP